MATVRNWSAFQWSRIFLGAGIFVLPFRIRTLIYSGTSYELGFFNEYAACFLYASELFFFLAFFFLALAVWRGESEFDFAPLRKFARPFLLVLGVSALAIFTAHDPTLALLFFARTLEFSVVTFLLALGLLPHAMTLRVLAVSFGLQTLLASVQFFSGHAFGFSVFGESDFSAATFNLGKIITESGETLVRGLGTLGHANILGGLLALVLVLIFSHAGRDESPNVAHKSRFQIALARYRWLGNYFLLALLTLGLFFTFSRAAFLALIFGAGILLLGNFKKTVLPILFATLVFGALASIYHEPFSARFDSSVEIGISNSTREIPNRLTQISRARDLILAHPLGVGRGSYATALFELQPTLEKYQLQPVHNFFILKAVEESVLVALAWLLLFSFLAVNFLRTQNFAGLAVVVMLFILANLDHYLADSFAGEGMMFVVLGLALSRRSY